MFQSFKIKLIFAIKPTGYIKVKQPLIRPGQALRIPGG
jgi:hypothetical protein